MDKDFLKIAVTVDYFYPREADEITTLLKSGKADFVHVRKPGADIDEVRCLISKIDVTLRRRLTLHDHPQVALELGIGGIHLNTRNPDLPLGWNGRVSKSCHSLNECLEAGNIDYVFLSPVFPSISKPGYTNDLGNVDAFLTSRRKNCKVIALGGVTSDKFPELIRKGFDGAAILSASWRRTIDPDCFLLHFITDGKSIDENLLQAGNALLGGCKWIQLRWKEGKRNAILEAAKRIAGLCKMHGAIFLIDDHVDLVEESGADGVHLGKNDMPVEDARKILGPATIIGATANLPGDILHAARAGADYVGYGPYRFTTTKKNLSPVLGLEGYRDAVRYCEATFIGLPLVAIGGITQADIPQIMATGVTGVAVSGEINRAVNPVKKTEDLIKTVKNNIKKNE